MKEKCKAARLNVTSTVRYRRPDEAGLGRRGYEHPSQNISINGIHLVSHERLAPGAVIQLQIENKRSKAPILANGKLSWVKKAKTSGFNIGVHFTHLAAEDKKRIAKMPR